MTALYLVDQPALVEFCQHLRGTPWLALDTEFIREKTYYPQLCLIQIATPERIACIDPLALPTLDPLLEVLYDPAITKVLHAAHQDLELLFHLRGAVPTPIFDTQLAALVLGCGEQISYAGLVQRWLGVELTKAHTRVDWRQRPLAAAWLAYAADDVRYLAALYPLLRDALRDQGWSEALAEDFTTFSDPDRYRTEPAQAWRRIRDYSRLSNARRAVLRRLAAWREEQARTHDRPRGWIVSDAALLELARRLPTDAAQLQRIPGLPVGTVRQQGALLLEQIRAARTAPSDAEPERAVRPPLTAAQVKQIEAAMELVATRAQQRTIPPATVASRRDVEALLAGLDSPLRRGWRAALVGRELQGSLAQTPLTASALERQPA